MWVTPTPEEACFLWTSFQLCLSIWILVTSSAKEDLSFTTYPEDLWISKKRLQMEISILALTLVLKAMEKQRAK